MRWSLALVGVSALALSSAGFAQSLNVSQVSQTGTNNQAAVDNNVPGNSGNSSTVIQNGFGNQASVYQREDLNRSFIQQIGTINSATHEQVGNTNALETRQSGDYNEVVSTQVGDANSGTNFQEGYYNRSEIRQGYALDDTVPSGERRQADNNTATVDQNGAGLSSVIAQRGASAAAPPASGNYAEVLQRSVGTTSAPQQISRIVQESAGNSATVSQIDGSVSSPNTSLVIQRTSTAPVVGSPAKNRASVFQSGADQSAKVTQDGLRNAAELEMRGGGAGDGNTITLEQAGSDLSGQVFVDNRRGLGAQDNTATVAQTGLNHRSTIYQFGLGDEAAITQGDGAVQTYGNEPARAAAFISQNGTGSRTEIRQTGDNSADMTQGFGAGSTASIAQVDAGDQGSARAFNSAIVAQYGDANQLTVAQDSLGSSATVWQKVGSANNVIDLRQGAGGTGLPTTTSTSGFLPGPTGSGTISASASITQSASYNSAILFQDGANLSAEILQAGAGSAALRNRVFISQTGSGNFAKATQEAGVGPSGADGPASGNSSQQNSNAGGSAVADEFYFAGGARSAEMNILQTSSNNSATVLQQGRGQFARVEQSGTGNAAEIAQDAAATNATAVIRQQGINNYYALVQSTPGHYVVVTQTGQGNSSTTVVTRP